MLQEKTKDDERIQRNIDRAGKNAFAFDTAIAAVILAYIAGFNAVDAWPLAVTCPFLGIVVFGLSYIYYDRKGNGFP
jgi:uncharacterized membrane protein